MASAQCREGSLLWELFDRSVKEAAVAHYMTQVDQMIEESEERADAELPPKLRLPLIRLKESSLRTLS